MPLLLFHVTVFPALIETCTGLKDSWAVACTVVPVDPIEPLAFGAGVLLLLHAPAIRPSATMSTYVEWRRRDIVPSSYRSKVIRVAARRGLPSTTPRRLTPPSGTATLATDGVLRALRP